MTCISLHISILGYLGKCDPLFDLSYLVQCVHLYSTIGLTVKIRKQ